MKVFSPKNPKSIQKMFEVLAPTYDQTNTTISLGVHHLWKKKLIQKSCLRPGDSLLDCATGTGDIAFGFESTFKKMGTIIAIDFCEPMLVEARKKALKKKSKVVFEWADIMHLPYKENQFDLVSISFGIRNVKDPFLGLLELVRVVKPGGKVLVLEFGQPKFQWISKGYDFYSKNILTKIGGWITGEPEAYHYLQSSSAVFPCGKEFLALAQKTQLFSRTQAIPLHFGIAYLYVLEKKNLE